MISELHLWAPTWCPETGPTTSVATPGFGDTERMHHAILLPDGRILVKYHYCSDYMENLDSTRGAFGETIWFNEFNVALIWVG